MLLNEEEKLRKLIDSIQYEPNLFKVYFGEGKYIMGYMSATPEDNSFFIYKTLYDTITDLDRKIKNHLILRSAGSTALILTILI